RRSTVYLHYKDKAEILTDIIADYTPKARAQLAKLPGPTPNPSQVQKWIIEVASFVATERVPLAIILELRRMNKTHAAVLETLTSELLSGLGENNVSFRKAARPNADALLRARALLLLQELTYVCELYLDDTDTVFAKALVRVTAEHFCDFLST